MIPLQQMCKVRLTPTEVRLTLSQVYGISVSCVFCIITIPDNLHNTEAELEKRWSTS